MADTADANYKALHYWDAYDFNAPSLIESSAAMEQEFIQFIGIMSHATLPREAFDHLASLLATNNKVLDHFMELAEIHLAQSTSPLYNETLYITMLESIVAQEKLAPIKREQIGYHLSMAQKNSIGSIAADLELLLRDGSHCNLSDIAGSYILLYLGDPDCSVCNQAKAELLTAGIITKMTADGILTVVSVCLEGKTDTWTSTPAPAGWIDACDENMIIYDEELYDLAGTPSFYLLDGNHRVILRDVHAGYVIEYLNNL